ncbi:MAG: hypothetical protein ACTSRS_15170 [Candidatus Helarchaeota archaeon]
MIEKVQEELKSESIDWVRYNVAEPEARQIAIANKIQFVPTTLIQGATRLVGVTTAERLKEEILKFK